jgi:predicted ATPase
VELVGEAGAALYARAGGNPFYLEQLARVPGDASPRARGDEDASVPAVVAAALAAELATLSSEAHRMLDGAAVTGDPFDPGLAADVADLPEREAFDALDELLARTLVRPVGAPRRFAFRHPVVRHAVYVAAPAGWRLGAHARAAAALARRGADTVQRAHHVEQAASPGDGEAVALLVAAGREARSHAPATAARFHAAALRLLPDVAEQRERRTELHVLLADARSAAGDSAGARETLLDALRTAEAGPASGPGADPSRLAITVGLANAEWWLGHNESARRRLQVALAELPASLRRIVSACGSR